MKVFIWVAYCGAFASVCLLSACHNAEADEKEPREQQQVLNDSVTQQVDIAEAQYKSLGLLIKSNGKIKSLRELVIYSETNGVVQYTMAEGGAGVSAGSLILQLDTTVQHFRLEKARVSIFSGKKELQSLMLGYQSLLARIEGTQREELLQKLNIDAGLTGAEQELLEAKHELKRSAVYAPFTGRLADVKIQQGQRLFAGQELFRIYDPAALFAEVKVMENEVAQIRPGAITEISSIAVPGVKYTGIVQEVNPYVDEHGMISVRIKVAGKTSELFPGMNCAATIQTDMGKALLVPVPAIVKRSGRSVVFTVVNGKAIWNYVETGLSNGEFIEIKGRISNGDKVIVSNNLYLMDGAVVTVNAPHSPIR